MSSGRSLGCQPAGLKRKFTVSFSVENNKSIYIYKIISRSSELQNCCTVWLKQYFIVYAMVEKTSLVAQTVKCLPTMRETWVWSLGREDPLEKEMATHSSIHAWKIPWTEEPGGLQSVGSQRVGHDWAAFLLLFFIADSLHCPSYQGSHVYSYMYTHACNQMCLNTHIHIYTHI